MNTYVLSSSLATASVHLLFLPQLCFLLMIASMAVRLCSESVCGLRIDHDVLHRSSDRDVILDFGVLIDSDCRIGASVFGSQVVFQFTEVQSLTYVFISSWIANHFHAS